MPRERPRPPAGRGLLDHLDLGPVPPRLDRRRRRHRHQQALLGHRLGAQQRLAQHARRAAAAATGSLAIATSTRAMPSRAACLATTRAASQDSAESRTTSAICSADRDASGSAWLRAVQPQLAGDVGEVVVVRQQQVRRAPASRMTLVSTSSRGSGRAGPGEPGRVRAASVVAAGHEVGPDPGAAGQVVDAPAAGQRGDDEQSPAGHRLEVEVVRSSGSCGTRSARSAIDAADMSPVSTTATRTASRVGAQLDVEEVAAAVQRRVGGELGHREADVVDQVDAAPRRQRVVDEPSHGRHALGLRDHAHPALRDLSIDQTARGDYRRTLHGS